TTARPDGVARMPSGGATFLRISFTTTARLASDAGVVAKIRFVALPSLLTVDDLMPAGATSKICLTSAPVGAIGRVPGTSVRKLPMLTTLDALARTRLLAGLAFSAAVQACGNRLASPYLQSCCAVNPSTKCTVLSENAS